MAADLFALAQSPPRILGRSESAALAEALTAGARAGDRRLVLAQTNVRQRIEIRSPKGPQ